MPRGEHGVRIELELRRDDVLLLDFDTWHCVLNRWHLSRSWRESKQWDLRTKGFDPHVEPLPPILEAELQSTWDRVFDFKLLRSNKLWGPVKYIQGVTEFVELASVRRVDKIVAR